MTVLKHTLWTLLLLATLPTFQGIAAALMHPIGGGEFHAIFAYSDGGRVGVAMQVYLEYVAVACLAPFCLVLLRYPAHWTLVASVASLVCFLQWLAVCRFPYQSRAFHRQVVALLPLIPVPIACCAFWTTRLSRRLFRQRDRFSVPNS